MFRSYMHINTPLIMNMNMICEQLRLFLRTCEKSCYQQSCEFWYSFDILMRCMLSFLQWCYVNIDYMTLHHCWAQRKALGSNKQMMGCQSDRSLNPSLCLLRKGLIWIHMFHAMARFTLILLLQLRMLAMGVNHKLDACTSKDSIQEPVHPHTKLSKYQTRII